jgi:hypothetical protein
LNATDYSTSVGYSAQSALGATSSKSLKW